MLTLTLPKPDAYGNYWLGEKPTFAPAIIRAGHPDNGAPRDAKGWFATTEDGPLFDGTRIRYFATPEMALAALKEIRVA
jgi:hypothetical protein